MGADNKPTNPAQQERNPAQQDQSQKPGQPQQGDPDDRRSGKMHDEHKNQQRDQRS
ncbi:hypothetical protein [Paracoccus shanxieyensis]|uniref:Uncharacterized protein n=1 Tax=Paracoccus shanxieyensis TaxID=2675752 RepID=A0A6L6J2P1_9RHOB|nr:hypothetical protein [Paracoccus shanxieyensis]MTH65034.1 hypothetical protein [Paracoccus shanxieyensis]MTH88062.1 hypothetical protein [Paracoccus shanxieyensis]